MGGNSAYGQNLAAKKGTSAAIRTLKKKLKGLDSRFVVSNINSSDSEAIKTLKKFKRLMIQKLVHECPDNMFSSHRNGAFADCIDLLDEQIRNEQKRQAK